MRSQAIETALTLLVKACEEKPLNENRIKNLCVKSKILMNRNVDNSSVIREFSNMTTKGKV